MEEKHYPILENINSPSDLKRVPDDAIPALCGEIREFLIDHVTKTGGHLASNLGVVELTVAIHRVFDAPRDSIVWDVGHQSYVHKLLTGRKNRFDTLRQNGGLSGFTKRSESEYDPFGAGHSSTSLSAALGISAAKVLSGDDSYTVAVMGDGAFTGGLVHEALNNAPSGQRIIFILNENGMSISRNIGGYAKHLQKIRTSHGYHNTKRVTRDILSKIPLIGDPIFRGMRKIKQFLKNSLYNSNYFEDLGLYYLGPIDGHDEQRLEYMLQEAKKSNQSCVVHVKTVKGKGFPPAESQPDLYHGISPEGHESAANFSSAFGDAMIECAQNDEKVVAITAAMADGCGLCEFKKRFPDRFYDVGIAEEHALVFAAGLAAGGYKPVFAVYSTFLQRGYDYILHDIALQNLPVVIGIDRAALSAGDGPTHHGIFDVAMLGQAPNMTLYAPFDFTSMKECLTRALALNAPAAIRYPNAEEDPDLRKILSKGDFGARACFTQDDDIDALIITYGKVVSEAISAATELYRRDKLVCGIILLEQLLPIDMPCEFIYGRLSTLKRKNAPVVFVEEGIRNGGIGMLIGERLALPNYSILAIDSFGISEEGKSLYESVGISRNHIIRKIKEKI